MKYIDKALEVVNRICTIVSALLLVWMLFAFSLQVISRYIFNTGFAWTEESTRYAMIWMVFFGAVVCTRQGINVAVDALEEFFPAMNLVIKTIQYVVTLVYCAAVCRFSAMNLANAAKQTSPNIKIPMNYLHMVFPVTAALIALYTLRHLVALWRHENYGGEMDEVKQALEAAEAEVKGEQ